MNRVYFQKHFWVKFLSTGFLGSYLIPFIPGIYGVALGIGLSLLMNSFPLVLKMIISFVLIGGSIPLCTKAEKILNKGVDPQNIVIDEVVGVQFAAIWFPLFQKITIFHYSLPLFVLLFFIYGVFDWLEPFPIKHIEKLYGGWGIVLDDLMAGIYTVIALLIIMYVF